MKVQITALCLGLTLCGVSAAPRGAGVRGQASQRKLQMDKDMDMNGGGGGGDMNGGGGGGQFVAAPGEDAGPTALITEYHACEPNPQAAIDYVTMFGYPDQGDMDCYADPVNACPGGCCRYANWFVCDGGDEQPHMPCVCNQNTADPALLLPPPVVEPPPVVDPTPPVGNATNVTLPLVAPTPPPTNPAPTPTPLTAEELAAQYPEIAANIEVQDTAPQDPAAPMSEEQVAALEAGAGVEDRHMDIFD